jgi:outer membrane murein-binding lipoprotein Lpp
MKRLAAIVIAATLVAGCGGKSKSQQLGDQLQKDNKSLKAFKCSMDRVAFYAAKVKVDETGSIQAYTIMGNAALQMKKDGC